MPPGFVFLLRAGDQVVMDVMDPRRHDLEALFPAAGVAY